MFKKFFKNMCEYFADPNVEKAVRYCNTTFFGL